MKTTHAPILLVIDHFGSGGAQRQIVAIANGLTALGNNVHVFVYYPKIDHYKASLNEKIIIHEAHKKGRFGFGVIFNLLILLYKNKYRSALAFLHTPAFYLELSSLFYFGKMKIYYSERSSLSLGSNNFFSKIKIKMHSLCDHITSNSIVQSGILAKIYGLNKVSYIPNVMDKSFFDMPLSDEKYKLKRFVVLAHTTPFKNYDYIADSLIEYLKMYDCVPPVVHWYGEIYQPERIEIMKRKLAKYGLESHLIFYGVVTNIKEVLNNAYFLLHPSKYESSANAVAESLAMSTPVLLGNISDHEIIIEQSKAGFIYNLNEPKELAEQINHMEKLSKSSYSLLSVNAKLFAEKHYKLEVVIAEYDNLLRGDLNKN